MSDKITVTDIRNMQGNMEHLLHRVQQLERHAQQSASHATRFEMVEPLKTGFLVGLGMALAGVVFAIVWFGLMLALAIAGLATSSP